MILQQSGPQDAQAFCVIIFLAGLALGYYLKHRQQPTSSSRRTRMKGVPLRSGKKVDAVVMLLDGKRGYERVRRLDDLLKYLPNDISGAECTDLLASLRGAERRRAIDTLAPKLSRHLKTSEAARILGPLSGRNRLNAIQTLAPKIKSDVTLDDLKPLLKQLNDREKREAVALLYHPR